VHRHPIYLICANRREGSYRSHPALIGWRKSLAASSAALCLMLGQMQVAPSALAADNEAMQRLYIPVIESPPPLDVSSGAVNITEFVDFAMTFACRRAPCALTAFRHSAADREVTWVVYTAAKYGEGPEHVATMDSHCFRPALARLGMHYMGGAPYFGSASVALISGELVCHAVLLMQNTPGVNWFTATIVRVPVSRRGDAP